MGYAETNNLARKLCGLPPIPMSQQRRDQQSRDQLNAARYMFLRDCFAMNAKDDRAEFAALAQLSGKEFDAAVDAAMSGETDEEEEPGYCTSCDGSGEGMHEGTRCYRCNGKGHAS
jgi:hypothetical protein